MIFVSSVCILGVGAGGSLFGLRMQNPLCPIFLFYVLQSALIGILLLHATFCPYFRFDAHRWVTILTVLFLPK